MIFFDQNKIPLTVPMLPFIILNQDDVPHSVLLATFLERVQIEIGSCGRPWKVVELWA